MSQSWDGGNVVRIYAQGPDPIMDAADKIVANILYNPEKKIKRWNKPFLLDNGGFQGKPVSSERLIAAAEKLKPDLLIVPDIRFDAKRTLQLHKDFVELADNKIMEKAVGVFRPEIQDMYSTLREYERLGFKWIANPTGEGYSDRGLSRFWHDVKKRGMKIHLLGAQDGTYQLLKNIPFDSIDFVSQDLKEFNEIKRKIMAAEIIGGNI